jgi:hypothetical protein
MQIQEIGLPPLASVSPIVEMFAKLLRMGASFRGVRITSCQASTNQAHWNMLPRVKYSQSAPLAAAHELHNLDLRTGL